MSDAPPNIDTRLIRRLAAILAETGLTEIEVEQDGLKIRVAREITVTAAPQVFAAAAPAAVAEPAPAAAAAAGPATDTMPAGEVVKSPMVGTVYLQAEPTSPAFVKVGDTVSAGQTLLIVEAMKTMNAIAAPKAGVVRALLVADGQPVQYGEALAVID